MSQIVVFTGPGTQNDNQVRNKISQASHGFDAVDKLRISAPQSLIDTDFEYGQQPTKWESITLQNNRPSCYYIPQQPLTITAITGNGTNVVTITGTFVIPANTPIFIQNALDPNANGWFLTTAGGTNSFVITTTAIVASGNQLNLALSYVYRGFFYTNAALPLLVANAFVTTGTTTVKCNTNNPHGLSPGSLIYVIATTSSGTSINGAQTVTATENVAQFTFENTNGAVGAAAITNTVGSVNLFPRPAGYVEARSFDGGVAFTSGANVPSSQIIRQSRRYFRYQSGKGIQFSTGTILCPNVFLTSLTSSGLVATVNTRFPHNLTAGCTIVVSDATPAQYNGTFVVTSVPTLLSFTYSLRESPGVSPAVGLLIKVSALNWFGSANRLGMHDQQNGIFFEYDGQELFAVWRNSVNQVGGTVAVTQGSATVVGTGTAFASQIAPGDFVVIRGQSYRVLAINSDNNLTLSQEYRGATISGALLSVTIDVRTPRTQWADKLDGTGPSKYVLDLTKIQMWFIDWSWYGAGTIRWGVRTTDGNISYVYQQQNNNRRFEAYMRSGNMASHYEITGISSSTVLTATVLNTATTGDLIQVRSTNQFAPAGVIRLTQSQSQSGLCEHISYSSKTDTSFTILARGVVGGFPGAQTFTFAATSPTQVEYASPDTSASLSHWGSSVIMDGRFDDDKSLIFNFGTTSTITTTSTTPIIILAIRIAPSVDNGSTGLLGAKEIINRSQLQLQSLGLFTTGTGYLINLVLNGFASGALSGQFQSPIQTVGGITSSLCQVATNTNAVNVNGGESVFATYTNPSGSTDLSLDIVRDLGNAILGGGMTNVVPTSQAGFFPDGPDILYIVATPLTATSSTILARLNWKEAQA